MNGCGDVSVVESVLASVVTTDVTLSTETASGTRQLALHRKRMIVGNFFGYLSAGDRKICRIVLVRFANVLRSKADGQIERHPLVS